MSATVAPPSSATSLEVYAAALEDPTAELWVRRRDGSGAQLPLDRWLDSSLTAADAGALARVHDAAPVLDVGCGPGRHVAALARRGVLALGIDISTAALAHALRRGAPVMETSVFDRVPNAGQWGSALLLDGNIGIGGCPGTLLRRLAMLVARGGTVVVELDAPGRPTLLEELRLEGDGLSGEWFAWAHVGVDGINALASESGMTVAECWEESGRWFAALVVQ